ncbi:hypothetical protein GA845_08335, partial [Burkholderia pseudomallei]|nr:hypothetical protein [Burkholderia pseudomallei]
MKQNFKLTSIALSAAVAFGVAAATPAVAAGLDTLPVSASVTDLGGAGSGSAMLALAGGTQHGSIHASALGSADASISNVALDNLTGTLANAASTLQNAAANNPLSGVASNAVG